MIYNYFIGRYMIFTYLRYIQYILFIHAFIIGKLLKKIKKHLRNHEAENSPKFKKHPGWPKNLVSYKRKNVYMICTYIIYCLVYTVYIGCPKKNCLLGFSALSGVQSKTFFFHFYHHQDYLAQNSFLYNRNQRQSAISE